MFDSKISFTQTTGFSFSKLLCTLKTTPTVIMHSTYREDHVTSTIMVLRIELRIFDQIVAETLMIIVCQTHCCRLAVLIYS